MGCVRLPGNSDGGRIEVPLVATVNKMTHKSVYGKSSDMPSARIRSPISAAVVVRWLWVAGIAGVIVGSVWNYAVSSIFTWKKR
jgi:hypothetical protein